MWDPASLRAMNDAVDVVRNEVLHRIGPHMIVDLKIYGDGHQELKCREHQCEASTQDELTEVRCGQPKRGAGWGTVLKRS